MYQTERNIISFGELSDYSTAKTQTEGLRQKNYSIPKLSLIIPVLEEEKIIEDTLNKYPQEILTKYNIELIISDGGSKDKTVEIAQKYTNKIIVHQGQDKQLISRGRNAGAFEARGEFLIFMNGDTYPENCEKFFTYVADWASGKGEFKDCAGLTCYVTIEPDELLTKDRIFYFLHNRYIRFLNFIGVGMARGECQIIRADIFKRLSGYNEDLAAGEDFDLFRRLAKIGKIGFVKELRVFESPRRFRKYGYLRVIISWLYNAIAVILKGKSISDNWEPVR